MIPSVRTGKSGKSRKVIARAPHYGSGLGTRDRGSPRSVTASAERSGVEIRGRSRARVRQHFFECLDEEHERVRLLDEPGFRTQTLQLRRLGRHARKDDDG